jgi:hypothetical protein
MINKTSNTSISGVIFGSIWSRPLGGRATGLNLIGPPRCAALGSRRQ